MDSAESAHAAGTGSPPALGLFAPVIYGCPCQLTDMDCDGTPA